MEDVTTSQRSAATGSSTVEAKTSAVSWAAILAGAVVAAATSLILVLVAAGMGLASVSPWSGSGASGTPILVMTAIALLIIQWLSAGVGGYVTGRLRTKWVGTHTHEVFFRDTAHGLLSWAVATVITVGLVSSATSSLVGTGVQATASVASGAAQAAAPAITAQASEANI